MRDSCSSVAHAQIGGQSTGTIEKRFLNEISEIPNLVNRDEDQN